MWSASMLVTTASTGCRTRNDASDSSASATRNSPLPRRACASAASSRPPMTKVGSRPPSASTLATRLVVVVLPCVPAIAMPCFRRISSASISARGTTGMPRSRAATTSGLSAVTAVDTTTTSASAMFAGGVAERDPCAELGEAPRHRAVREVRAGHAIALRQQHLGDAAHAGAADADEMHALDLVLHRPRASATHARRRGPPRPLRRPAAPRSPSPADAPASSRAGMRPGVPACSSACGTSSAPPASTRKRALCVCSSAIAPGQRHQHRRHARRGQLGHGESRRRGRSRGRPARSGAPCRR